MPILSSFGKSVLGFSRLGDGSYTFVRPLSSVLSVSYSITLSKYSTALPVTYIIEKAHVSSLQVYYQISPPTQFAINGDEMIVRPDHITYTPLPVVGHTLLGSSILQGYRTMTWTYTLIRWSEYAHLLSFYNPQQPEVMVNYPDDNGDWQQKRLIMTPPVLGTLQQMIISNLSFTFLIPSLPS